MHLGIYRFAGDPQTLLAAYDRLMAGMPPGSPPLAHLCVLEPDGITIYDTCPSEEAFRGFSTSDIFHQALAAAGLPEPQVTGVPVHNARIVSG
jgi:hypothetical protein